MAPDPEIDVAALADLTEARGCCAEVGTLSLALFRQGETVFALENDCPHRGGPLCEGDVLAGVVYCPLHAWGFDLRTGHATNVRRAKVAVFPARVQHGRVLVRVGAKASGDRAGDEGD